MNARFEEIARKYLTVGTSTGSEWMCFCPFHPNAHSPSLQFNVDKGLWVCFGCDAKGSAKSLVRRLGGTYSDPSVSVDILQKSLDHLRLKDKEPKSEQVLQESYLLRFGGRPHKHWTEDRGFTSQTIEKWNLGYDPILDRCTIPYRNPDGGLLGVIQRRLDDEFPRYIYPKGFSRITSLFGSWKVAGGRGSRLAIVEGSTDTIQLSQADVPGASQYGSSLSPAQLLLLKRLDVREVVLFYDYDISGRKAERQARNLIDGIVVRRVEWDEDEYCWHEKVCGCDLNHSWDQLALCVDKNHNRTTKRCKCGRKHEMDPGKLDEDEISGMFENAVLVGRKRSWRIEKSAKSGTARRRPTGD